MKMIEFLSKDNETLSDKSISIHLQSGQTYSLGNRLRYVFGYCPDCKELLILPNNGEVWELFKCDCGFTGDTHSVLDKVSYYPMFEGRNHD